MTLMEILVAMTIMSVVMAAVTTGLVQMFRATTSAESRAIAQSQVSLALLRLDRQIRYASGISVPHLAADGTQLVEYLFVQTGKSTCAQLRVNAQRLQQRTWVSGSFSPTGWITLASGLASAAPFSRVDSTDEQGHQRLRIALSVVSGSGGTVTTRHGDVAFTALNTDRDSSAAVCVEGL
jgi:Tfp pilus assembly protein PilV